MERLIAPCYRLLVLSLYVGMDFIVGNLSGCVVEKSEVNRKSRGYEDIISIRCFENTVYPRSCLCLASHWSEAAVTHTGQQTALNSRKQTTTSKATHIVTFSISLQQQYHVLSQLELSLQLYRLLNLIIHARVCVVSPIDITPMFTSVRSKCIHIRIVSSRLLSLRMLYKFTM